MDEEFKNEDTEEVDEEVFELMENYGLEKDFCQTIERR